MPLPQQNARGIKRRRLDEKESEDDREVRLRRKLRHAVRELRKVVKKTRTFEVQKTLKKLKDARHKHPEDDTTPDLGAQLEILKHLSYDQLACSALMTKLRKDKTLSADPSIRAMSMELASNLVSPGAPGTPTAKVQSRILSSKVLASEVASTVEALRACLHPPARLENIGVATDNPHVLPNNSKEKRRIGTGHERDFFLPKDNITNPSGDRGDEGYENADDDEVITKVDDSWESGTVGAQSRSDYWVAGSADGHDSSSDDSNDVTSSRDSSGEGGFTSENTEGNRSQSHRPKNQSEFLPSLLVGFARGDSGSDFSDGEAKSVGTIKKNRRGQRARRAIWEKKYGKHVNHLKKRQQQATRHGSGSHLPDSVRVDRRSGKANSSSRPHRSPTQFHPPTHGRERVHRPVLWNSGLNNGQPERIQRKRGLWETRGEARLHPSWEAKKKQQAVSIVPSQGTKIVFSES